MDRGGNPPVEAESIMTARNRIIFVNRFYWPEEPATAQLLTDLAEALAAEGWDVTVLASHPGMADLPAAEIRRGVSIVRLRSGRRGASHLVGRALDFISFSIEAKRTLRHMLQAGDTVVMLTDPPLLGAFVARMVHSRGARLFHWIQDVYPEVAAVAGGSRIAGFLRPWRDRAWRAADGCVAISEDLAQLVVSRHVANERVSVVPNWAPEGLLPPVAAAVADLRASWGLSERFVVAYSGNLGRVHDLRPIIDLAEALRDDQRIAFAVVGRGAQEPGLRQATVNKKLGNIHFFPPQPRAHLAESLSAGDLHLVTLRPGCEQLVFPSKLYGIAAVGRPVLTVSAPGSELARIVTAAGFGFAFTSNQTAAMAETVRRLASHRAAWETAAAAALAFHARQGGVTRAAKGWIALLTTTMPLAPSAAAAKLPAE
jgi:colanic acid biosynthesis glycosyl transferase WcaI